MTKIEFDLKIPKIDLKAIKETPEAQARLKKLRQAAEDFEAIFAKLLVGEMRKGGSQGIFGKSLQAQIYADLLDEAVAKQVARGGGLGIAKTLFGRMEETLLRQLAAEMRPDPAKDAKSTQRDHEEVKT